MTRTGFFFLLLGLSVLLAPPVTSASPADTTADIVLGQLDFMGKSINQGKLAPTAATLQEPQRMAIDPTTGRLWLADSLNNRVLSWPSPATLTNDQPADIVLGQPDFIQNSANGGSATPTKT